MLILKTWKTLVCFHCHQSKDKGKDNLTEIKFRTMSFLLDAFENQTSYSRQSSASRKVLWLGRLQPSADMKCFHALHSFVNAKNRNNDDSKTWRVLGACFSAELWRMQDLRHIRTREGKSIPQRAVKRSGKCQSTGVPWEQGEVRCGCIAGRVSTWRQNF